MTTNRILRVVVGATTLSLLLFGYVMLALAITTGAERAFHTTISEFKPCSLAEKGITFLLGVIFTLVVKLADAISRRFTRFILGEQ